MVDKADGLKGVRCAPIASGDKPLTPSALSTTLSQAVYASLLHFGVETAPILARPSKGKNSGIKFYLMGNLLRIKSYLVSKAYSRTPLSSPRRFAPPFRAE